jgi:hypothetical protein
MELAGTLVDSLGKGQVLAWSLEEKALVAPYAVMQWSYVT